MMGHTELCDEYIRRLLAVNDETKTEKEHRALDMSLHAWRAGVRDASGIEHNGDHYYIDLINDGEMEERPMCCGVFLDWKPDA